MGLTTSNYTYETMPWSQPAMNYVVYAVASRSTESSTSVSVTVRATVGFNSSNGIVYPKTNYSYSGYTWKFEGKITNSSSTSAVSGGSEKSATLHSSSSGEWRMTSSTAQTLDSASGCTVKGCPTIKSATLGTFTITNWTSGSKVVRFSFLSNNSEKGSGTLTLDCPDYYSGPSYTSPTASLSASTYSGYVGDSIKLTATVGNGTNTTVNSIKLKRGTTDVTPYSWSNSAGTYTTYISLPEGSVTYTLEVATNVSGYTASDYVTLYGEAPPEPDPELYSVSLSYENINGQPANGVLDDGLSHTVIVNWSGVGTIGCYEKSIINNTVQAKAGETLTFYTYSNGTTSQTRTAKVGSISLLTASLQLTLAQIEGIDNVSQNIAVKIQSAQVTTANGTASSYSWQYRTSTTTSFSGSWYSLGYTSSSISNIDLTTFASAGTYIQIRCAATGPYNTANADSSAIRIPRYPQTVNIRSLTPRANLRDITNPPTINTTGTNYYGAGIFLEWTNPTPVLSSGYLPIQSVDIVYGFKQNTTSSTWGESRLAPSRYYVGPTTTYDPTNQNTPGVNFGAGAELDAVPALYATRVGVRVTDILGQTTDTFYTGGTGFSLIKSQGPSFGANDLVVSANFPVALQNESSEQVFRPLYTLRGISGTQTYDQQNTTIELNYASSNVQDDLIYKIDFQVPSKNIIIPLFEGKINSSAFGPSGTVPIGGALTLNGTNIDSRISAIRKTVSTMEFTIRNSYIQEKCLSVAALNSTTGYFNVNYDNCNISASAQDDTEATSEKLFTATPISLRFVETPYFESTATTTLKTLRIQDPDPNTSPTYLTTITTSTEDRSRVLGVGDSLQLTFTAPVDKNNDITHYKLKMCTVNMTEETPSSIPVNPLFVELKTYSAAEAGSGSNKVIEYKLENWNDSKYCYYGVTAVDSKNNESTILVNGNYLVPCRVTAPTIAIRKVETDEPKSETGYQRKARISLRVKDLGGAIFESGSRKNYSNYLNIERIIAEDNNFKSTANINFYATRQITSSESNESNWVSLGNFSYVANETLRLTSFLEQERELTLTGFEDAQNLYFKVDITFIPTRAYEGDKSINTSTPTFSSYFDAPTMSYRSHQVGINTKNFQGNAAEGEQAVLIVQDSGPYNIVKFIGAGEAITISLNEHSLFFEENGVRKVINFKTGSVDNFLIDGGTW